MQEKLIKEWNDVINKLKLASENIAFAFFDDKENLLYANTYMSSLLGTTQKELKPTRYLVNPNLGSLKELKPNEDNLIFKGLLTIGNFSNISYVLKTNIFRKSDLFFVYAETDSLALFEDNKKMSRLNQEVNNLQRLLLKEKLKLEKTLKELKETQQMLIHSEKMNALGQMVAGVAHEINNPIAFINNNLYELEKNITEIFEGFEELNTKFHSSNNTKAIDLLEQMKTNIDLDYLIKDIADILSESQMGVERVKQIVEDLRKFSRLDESEIKHIDLIENINSTISILSPNFKKKEINFKIKSDKHLFTDCYPGQLNQALLNILVNAIDAVDNKGTIELSIEKVNNEVCITLKDNGSGIEQKNVNKVFNPFFTTKPIGQGTGLGLSITYKIIRDLHKGKIEIQSKVNQGTTIKISIPENIKS